MSDFDDGQLRRRLARHSGPSPDVDAALARMTVRARRARRERMAARVGAGALVGALLIGGAATIANRDDDGGSGVADTTVTSPLPTVVSSTSTTVLSTVPLTVPTPTTGTDATVPGTVGTEPTVSGPGTSAPVTAATAPPAAPEERTVSSTGGSIRVRLADGALTLLSSQPAAGYAAEIEDARSDRVRVRFESSSETSRITVTVESGRIATRVDE